jgi:predicted choloylglycine hydrolase
VSAAFIESCWETTDSTSDSKLEKFWLDCPNVHIGLEEITRAKFSSREESSLTIFNIDFAGLAITTNYRYRPMATKSRYGTFAVI